MSDPFFFGYGSLVNRATHSYPDAARARVSGWRRQWKKTRLRKLAFLTVTEAPAAVEIEGLIAGVPGADWAALDLREAAYHRFPVTAQVASGSQSAQIYRTRPEHDSEATDDHPILLSYLDAVLQGFAVEFGTEGVARFFATTEGWDAPILNDRDAPIYPRAQVLTAAQEALVDRHLGDIDARMLSVSEFTLLP